MSSAESRYLWNRAAEPVRREFARCRAGESHPGGALTEMLRTLAQVGTEIIRRLTAPDEELVRDIASELAGIQRAIATAV